LLRDDKRDSLKLARRVFRAAQFAVLGADGAVGVVDVGLTFVHDLEMRALNRAWRKIDEPTDVLSFPLDEQNELGDLVISVDTARRQAREQGHSLDIEVAVLVAHGLCHLAGLDHERNGVEERVQRACEQTLLAAARIDPAASLTSRTQL
jgi:rRNA maturation RNase YbeY